MKTLKILIIRFLISSVIYLIGLIGYRVFSTGLKQNLFALFVLGIYYAFACFVNLIITPIIYAIEKKSIVISLFFFLTLTWFFYFILKNEYDYTDYEYWNEYNHQTLILPKLDYFIGHRYLEIIYTLPVILIHFIIGIGSKCYITLRNKNSD